MPKTSIFLLLTIISFSFCFAQVNAYTPPDCLNVTFSKSLYLGLNSDDVYCLQKILNKDPATKVANSGFGSPGYETIHFGPATKTAVGIYQAKNDLPRLGIVGPLTREKLNMQVSSAVAPAIQKVEQSPVIQLPKTICGDSVIQTPNSSGQNELCDGTNIGPNTCVTQGYTSGQLLCNPNCLGFNFSNCVFKVNNAPVLASMSDKTVAVGSRLSFQVSSTDADNDSITYSATSLPPGSIFQNQIFSWVPTSANVNIYYVTFLATDSKGGQDSKMVTITVTDASVPLINFTITSSAGANGSISPSGAVSVNSGSKQIFGVVAAPGYVISNILVDGYGVSFSDPKDSDYTFLNITSNHTISTTFVQSTPQRIAFDFIRQTDETSKIYPWDFLELTMPARYPFLKKFQILYLNDSRIDIHTDPNDPDYLKLDMNRVQTVLNNQDPASNFTVPPGTYIALDLEGRKWSPYSNTIARPNPGWINTDVINAKAQIITAIKAMRPDCYFSFYNFPESNGVAGTLHVSNDTMGQPITDESLDEIEVAGKPVIDASDYIAQDFYWYDKMWTVSQEKDWIAKVVARSKKYYPNKEIIPFTAWIFWGQMTADMGNQGYPWTPEKIADITVPGPDWRQALDAMSAAGIDRIILYGDGAGWMPWDPHAPWWLQTMDWLGVPANQQQPTISLNNIQKQIASLSNAVQNLINSFKK